VEGFSERNKIQIQERRGLNWRWSTGGRRQGASCV